MQQDPLGKRKTPKGTQQKNTPGKKALTTIPTFDYGAACFWGKTIYKERRLYARES
jgi:hypothetical protein